MIGIIIITHGDFSLELLKTTNLLLGIQLSLEAITLPPSCSYEKFKEKIMFVMKQMKEIDEFLFLVDMYGGSCSTISLKIAHENKDKKIKIITGVNLSMIIAALELRESKKIDEILPLVIRAGKDAIIAPF